MPTNEPKTNFDIVCTVTTKLGITYTKYRSRETGLSVVLADIDAPLVDGFFVVATESFDDYGCPHTLEHLVFLGSEQYPYKGVLDSLANRAIAQGTNAWTDTDTTCYTITTAGSEGFLRLMPIYVDHILHPTLTETGCYTEVHHINGKGENAGVVYSEIQGRENLEGDRLDHHMHHVLFPEGCGYRYETGGMMEKLREITVDQIRNYHKSCYRPDNLCLLISGKVKHEDLMAALAPIEENILKKGPLPPMQRPWVSTGNYPDLKENITESVFFADEDESMGSIRIVWNGPERREWLEIAAINTLNSYLTESSVAVLQREFVEIEEPLCTDLYIYSTNHMKLTYIFDAESVPLEFIDGFADHLFETLERIVAEEDIDMERMATVIHNNILEARSAAERGSSHSIVDACISDFTYGAMDGSDLANAVKDVENLEKLQGLKKSDWINLLKKTYLDKKHAVFLGKPSSDFAHELAENERDRIEKQRTDLGEAKLAELQETLEKAMAANDAPVPKECIENFEIPPVSSIRFIDVETARNNANEVPLNEVQKHVNLDKADDVPLFIQFDHIKSYFVRVFATLNVSSIPSQLLPYTSLFIESMFTLPMEKDGRLIPYEEVVKGLNEDVLDYASGLGVSGVCEQLAQVVLKVESSKYAKAIERMKDTLWNTRFTPERLVVVAKQILNDIPQAKRDGRSMLFASMRAIQEDATKSAKAARSALFQANFLETVLKKLEEDPDSIIADMDAYRSALCQPKNIRIHVLGDIMQLEYPRTSFRHFCPNNEIQALEPMVLRQETLTPKGKNPGNMAMIINLPTIENSYSNHCAKGPNKFNDPDIPSLLVLNGLLNAMEGIFWKLIRGQGLAYSCSIGQDAEIGMIYFSISSSPDAFKAFEQAKIVIEKLAKEEVQLNPLDIDGAKSGVIFAIVNEEKSMESAGIRSFVNQVLKQMPASYNKDLLESVQAVKKDDILRVLRKYVVGLFQPDTSNVCVVSTPTKVKDISDGFASYGFLPKEQTLDDIARLSPFAGKSETSPDTLMTDAEETNGELDNSAASN